MKKSSTTKTFLAIGIAVAILYFVSQKDTFGKFINQEFETVPPSFTGIPSSTPANIITIVPQLSYAPPTMVPTLVASMMPTQGASTMMPTMIPGTMIPGAKLPTQMPKVAVDILAPYGSMSPMPTSKP